MSTDTKVIAVSRSETRRGDPMWTLQTVDGDRINVFDNMLERPPWALSGYRMWFEAMESGQTKLLGEHADLVRHRQAAQVSGSYVSATGNALREAGQTYRTGGRLGTVRTSLMEYALVAQRRGHHRLRHRDDRHGPGTGRGGLRRGAKLCGAHGRSGRISHADRPALPR